MAELAVTDGMPPPGDLPRGTCIVTRLDDGSFRVDQADPRVLISAELLDAVNGAGPRTPWLDLAARATYDGELLKIHGVNRTVIYRIGEYVHRAHCYIGEWPD
jgi:hypothetical protein